MKTKVFVIVLFLLAISQSIMAQRNENGFSVSAGFIFNIAEIHFPKENSHDMEMGVNLNLIINKNSNFGYYINIYGLFDSPPFFDDFYNDGYPFVGPNANFQFGIIPGIGYKKAINDYLSFFVGIGPEISYSSYEYYIGDPVTGYINDYGTLNNFGIGLGGTLEARLKIYKNLSFAGGVLMRHNFFGSMRRNFNAHPYIGFSFN